MSPKIIYKDSMEFRIESDSVGLKMVPKNAYYGVQTLRAAENFNITGRKMMGNSSEVSH